MMSSKIIQTIQRYIQLNNSMKEITPHANDHGWEMSNLADDTSIFDHPATLHRTNRIKTTTENTLLRIKVLYGRRWFSGEPVTSTQSKASS